MRFLGRFLTIGCLCCVLATSAYADRIIESATLDGTTHVNVTPSASIIAQVTVRTTTGGGGSDNWRSIAWRIDSGPITCENSFDYSSAGTHTEPFNIVAPGADATYSVTFTAYQNNNCSSGASAPYTMTNAITVGGVSEVNYRFDETFWIGSVEEIQDSSGNNFHATATNGPTTAAVSPAIPGNPGTCYYGVFDGVDDYVALPSGYPDLTTDFTITAWIRTTDNTRSGQRILIDDQNNTQGFGFSLGDGGTGRVRFFSRNTSPIILDTPNVVANNTWYFVAAVADISNNIKRIYVYDQAGNQLAAISNTYSGSWGHDVGNASMGGENNSSGESGPNFHFMGNLDEVRVHDGALTAAQISALQNTARMCVYPIAEYRFEGCDWTTGAVVQDELGNYPGAVIQGAHTAPGADFGGGLCNVANLQNEGTDYDRHISLTGNPIPLSGDWTLMMWINFPPGFNNHFLYSNYRYSVIAGGDHDLCWIREHTVTGERYWGASSSPTAYVAAFPSTLTGWHHLTFVGNGTDTDLYVDGVYSNSVGYKQNGNYTSIGTTADFVSNTARQNLDTQLDELKFYDGALPAANITAIYAMENAGLRWDGSPLNCQLCGAVDHIRLEHTGVGLTCQRSDIMLRACADAACSSESADPVTVTMTPATANPPTWIGGDTQEFTGHQTFQLRQTLPGTVSLGLTNPNPVPTNNYKCFDSGVEGDCDIDFFDTGFIYDVPDLTSCQTSSNISIQAVRMDDTTQACIADGGFSGANKTVNFWSTYVNPATGTEQVSLSGTNVATAGPGTGIPLNFDANATASFTVNYPDAGQMQLNARYDGVSAEEAGLVMLGADSFITRPVGLCVYTDDASSDCVAGDGSCSVFKRVDEAFNLKVKGVCWESSGDTDFCSGNSTTPNFQLNSIPIAHSLVAPSGGTAGNIGVASIDLSAADNGEHIISNQTVSEVGVYTFTATPPDYLGGALPVATSVNVGRFTPDHFITSLTNNGVLQNGCSGFTYSGQTFSYDPPNFPDMLITATGSAGNTTVNYRDDFVKLTNPATQIGMPAVTADASQTGTLGTPLALTWAPAASTLVQNNDGTLNFTLGADQFTYTRETNALIAPFTSDIQLFVTSIVDTDGTAATGLPSAFSPTGTEIRYGQMQLQNAYGPETLPLTIPVLTEYFNGSGFIPNSLDNCSTYDFLHLTLSNFQGNLVAGDTIASGNGTLLSGLGNNLSLSAPGVGNDGSVDLEYDLDAAGLSWLKPGGNNPRAKATFGIFKGNQRLIYMRESIW
ncbi:MAG: LamG domain-containing protein [Gammaproteobacteria bacterium]|nr:LamG domain-containing protein [Gammaproteobacteria bacterium]